MNESFGSLQTEMNTGMLVENGQKCKAASKGTVKDCYEFTYEPIKGQSGPPKEVVNGCCSLF